MSVYMTEEEQLEQLKKWWNNYGHWVTTALSVVLLCFAGYKFMVNRQEKVNQQASATYENMMVALSNQDMKEVRSYANALIKDHSHSIYADVAHMTLAKVFVSKEKFDKAKEELQFVVDKGTQPALKQIAKIRIARILAADKAYDKALDELAAVTDKIYLPVINELKGDIYSATGKYHEATTAYKLALEQAKTSGVGSLLLEMKTNDVALHSESQRSDDNKVTLG